MPRAGYGPSFIAILPLLSQQTCCMVKKQGDQKGYFQVGKIFERQICGQSRGYSAAGSETRRRSVDEAASAFYHVYHTHYIYYQ